MLTRKLTRRITQALTRKATDPGSGGAAAFDPASLFSSGEQGVWYDPSDFSTMFQDAAGTTPVTAVEQPVGCILDRRLSTVYTGPLTGWSKDGGDGTVNVVGNQATVTGATTTTQVRVPAFGPFDAGWGARWYPYHANGGPESDSGYIIVEVTVSSISGTWLLYVNGSPITLVAGFNRYRLNTKRTGSPGELVSGTGSITFTVDRMEFYPGNHAWQNTTAQKPVLSARKNKLLATTTMATQSVTLDASPHTLSFKGTGTVTLSGASTAGPLVGTGAGARVSLTFTPTAGSVTFTVSGSVTEAQLEDGSAVTTYQRVNTATDYDTVGFPHYLKFDGVDDNLVTGNIDFTATDKMTVLVGQESSLSTYGVMLETGNSVAAPGFALVRAYAGAGDYSTYSYGSGFLHRQSSDFAGPDKAVVAAIYDNAQAAAADEAKLRRNGVEPSYATTSGGAGTGNFANNPLKIGSRYDSTSFWKGNINQLIVRGAATPLTDIENAESFIANKTGVTL